MEQEISEPSGDEANQNFTSSPPTATPASSNSPPAAEGSSSSSDAPPPSPPPPPPAADSAPPPPQISSPPPPPPSPSNDDPPSSSSPPTKGSPPSRSGSKSPPSPPDQPAVPSATHSNAVTPPRQMAIGKSRPSNSSSKSKDASNSSSKGSGSNLPMVLGVAVGVGLFLALMVVAYVMCVGKKKNNNKKKKHHRYDPAQLGPKGGYYNEASLPRWQNGHMGNGLMLPGGTYSSDMSGPYSGPHGPALPPPSPGVALGFNKSTFTYEELAAATNGFSQANLLGQGGFGYVHKGVLPNGKEIAVKQLKSGSGQGEREFQAEVEIISRVHHRHLVSLVGYCIAGHQRILVYEFVPNGTLEYHLYGTDLPTMDWPTRLKIAVGSAKGLAYLHEDCHPRIIHRDIKAANILVDNKFEAMVADFGLAKLSSDTNTHVSTRVMGTFGYLAPEYASTGKLTEKSDVFSFGVMLLELITGRRPVNHAIMEDSLVDWARHLITQPMTDQKLKELVDPRLENNYNAGEMTRMVSCAAASIRHAARRRPRMSQIVRALEGDVSLDDLNEGVKPGQNSFFSSGSDHDSASYSSNMRHFRKVALGEDFSNDYSAPASEYGQNPSASSSSGEMNSAGPKGGKASS